MLLVERWPELLEQETGIGNLPHHKAVYTLSLPINPKSLTGQVEVRKHVSTCFKSYLGSKNAG